MADRQGETRWSRADGPERFLVVCVFMAIVIFIIGHFILIGNLSGWWSLHLG